MDPKFRKPVFHKVHLTSEQIALLWDLVQPALAEITKHDPDPSYMSGYDLGGAALTVDDLFNEVDLMFEFLRGVKEE